MNIAWLQSARGIGTCDLQQKTFQGCLRVNRLSRYDFDLKTGKSETGLRACTYAVQLRTDPESGVEKVYMETPEGGSHWRLVELRPVSEGGFNLYYASAYHSS